MHTHMHMFMMFRRNIPAAAAIEEPPADGENNRFKFYFSASRFIGPSWCLRQYKFPKAAPELLLRPSTHLLR